MVRFFDKRCKKTSKINIYFQIHIFSKEFYNYRAPTFLWQIPSNHSELNIRSKRFVLVIINSVHCTLYAFLCLLTPNKISLIHFILSNVRILSNSFIHRLSFNGNKKKAFIWLLNAYLWVLIFAYSTSRNMKQIGTFSNRFKYIIYRHQINLCKCFMQINEKSTRDLNFFVTNKSVLLLLLSQ